MVDHRLIHERWVAFAAGRNEESFVPFFEATSGLVYTIARRRLAHEEEARDAVQSTYARLLAIASKAEEVGLVVDAANLVLRLAMREADAARKRVVRRGGREFPMDQLRSEPASSGADGREWASQEEARRALAEELAALPEKLRLPVELHYLHGLTHEEIATSMGVPRTTVSSRIQVALERLQPRLRRRGINAAALAGGGALLVMPGGGGAAAAAFAAASAAAPGVPAGLCSVAAIMKGSVPGGAFVAVAATVLVTAFLLIVAVKGVSMSGSGPAPARGSGRTTQQAPASENVFGAVRQKLNEDAKAVGPTPVWKAMDGTISLRVRWEGRPEPVEGAQLSLAGPGGEQVLETRSDGEGLAGFEAVAAPGVYTLTAEHPDAVTWKGTIPVGHSSERAVVLSRRVSSAGAPGSIELVFTTDGTPAKPLEGASALILVGQRVIVYPEKTDSEGRLVVRVPELGRSFEDSNGVDSGMPPQVWLLHPLGTGHAFVWGHQYRESEVIRVAVGGHGAGDNPIVRGAVLRGDGSPIAGAIVQHCFEMNAWADGSRFSVTEEPGNFVLEDLFWNPGACVAWAPGYGAEVHHTVDRQTTELELRMVLEPEAFLDVTVVDEGGEPIANAEVVAFLHLPQGLGNWLRNPSPESMARTDEAGVVRLGGLPARGELKVEAQRPGYERASEEGLAAGGSATLRLLRSGSARVRVVDARTGSPIAGAWDSRNHRAVSNAEGEMSICCGSVGSEIHFTVEATGYRSAEASAVAGSNEVRDIRLTRADEWGVLVVDRVSTEPVPGAVVTWAPAKALGGVTGVGQVWRQLGDGGVGAVGAEMSIHRVETDGGGVAILDDDGEEVVLVVTAGGHEPVVRLVAEVAELRKQAAAVIELTPATGSIGLESTCDGAAFPIKEVLLAFHHPDLGWSRRGQVDEEGRLLFEGLQAGEYSLQFRGSEDGREFTRHLNLKDGEDVTVGCDGIFGTLELSGRVLDAEGNAAAGAMVRATQYESEGGDPRKWRGTREAVCRTGADGTFRLYGLVPGRADLRLGNDLDAAARVELPSAEPVVLKSGEWEERGMGNG